MPDIFKAWRWFVGMVVLAFVGLFSLPKGCALRPSDEFVGSMVDRAVDRAVEKLEENMEFDADQLQADPDAMENGYDIPTNPLECDD